MNLAMLSTRMIKFNTVHTYPLGKIVGHHWVIIQTLHMASESGNALNLSTFDKDVSLKTTKLDGILQDIQDGQIWEEFVESGFFSSHYNVGLMLNVDWFSPFKRSQYKVAAIMFTVLNLPREERFKKRWTIIAGMLQCVCVCEEVLCM